MGALDEFLGGSGVSRSDPAFQITREKQRNRDIDALNLLKSDLANETDPAQKAGIQKEIDNLSKLIESGRSYEGLPQSSSKTAPVSTSALDDFLSGAEEPAKPAQVRVEVRGGQQPQPQQQVQQPQEPTAPTGARNRAGVPVKDTSDVFTGAMGGLARTIGGAARGAATAALGAPGDINKLIVENIGSLFPNAPALPTTQEIQQALPGQPTSQEGQVAQKLGEFLPIPAVPKVARAPQQLTEQFAAKTAPVAKRVEPVMAPVTPEAKQAVREMRQPEMAGVGAAKTANAAILEEAKARATPELRAELDKIKPNEINVEALNRIMAADQLPVPIRYTKGQALQDPDLISYERNIRGKEPDFVTRFNEQNKALSENVQLMKERVAPDVNTIDYVSDAENTIDLMKNRIKADDAKITEAYDALKNYGAGKLEVDSGAFANNALKALSESDEAEFLPSTILNRINAYKEGKPMNFNQFENLRTVLARETRKAQTANDGNMVHALTVVRSELEKMPLLNETGEAKVLADKARSLAKAQFDLLDKKRSTYNPLYADVMNGAADTKDFIQKIVFNSKNKDFVKTLETLKDDPQAIQHIRSGALDYIIRNSVDASGNFATAKFNKFIDNLIVNKKLVPLFGENAKTIEEIAAAAKNIEARPKGSYVNESNTLTAAGRFARSWLSKQAEKAPLVGKFVEPITETVKEMKSAKEVRESLKPGAGVKLKDIGKK